MCLGNEPVRIDGEVVGRVTSGGQGFAVENSIAYAYLPPDRGDRHSRRGRGVRPLGRFQVVREPLYDPDQRYDPIVNDGDYGEAWSASLRRGTEDELKGWLDEALAACDEADAIARAHLPA